MSFSNLCSRWHRWLLLIAVKKPELLMLDHPEVFNVSISTHKYLGRTVVIWQLLNGEYSPISVVACKVACTVSDP